MISNDATAPVVETPEMEDAKQVSAVTGRRFPAGLELGIEEAAEIMRGRYGYLIGILGNVDAGKTCFLLSLYLMASHGLIPGCLFAGSQTLPGFEARARLLREWGGEQFDHMADHTRLDDPRRPAFLHLALRETGGQRRLYDLLLTDLPGEWSASLVDRAETASRFGFLRRADGIIVVLDGPLLVSASRHVELQRARHLLNRLVEAVGIDETTPLVLLVSKCDELRMVRPSAIDELVQHATSLGLSPVVAACASFSKVAEIPHGSGVFEALKTILTSDLSARRSTSLVSRENGRAFLAFGRSIA